MCVAFACVLLCDWVAALSRERKRKIGEINNRRNKYQLHIKTNGCISSLKGQIKVTETEKVRETEMRGVGSNRDRNQIRLN